MRIHANSLNSHDLAVILGHLPTERGRVLLSDGAGVVDEVGADIQEFKVGDAVISTFFPQWKNGSPPDLVGSFALTPGDGVHGYAQQWIVRKASDFTLAPKGYTHEAAATLVTAGLTAWRALVSSGNMKAGDTVLVQGTGGVSIFALQFAKEMGATVILISSSDEKLERGRQLGADFTVNYRRNPDWSGQVLALTNGRGVDHVIEVGGALTLNKSIQALRVGGHIAQIGVLSGNDGIINMHALLARQVRLQGIGVGSREHQIEMVRALNALDIQPVVAKSFPLQDIADACRYQMAGSHVGKIVLTL